MKKIFFIDIDGTLLGKSDRLSDRTVLAVKKAQAAGHRVFINTGRGKACVPRELERLGADGMVSGCGCTVTIGGHDVYSSGVGTDVLQNYIRGIFARGEKCFLEGERLLFRINIPQKAVENDPYLAKYCALGRVKLDEWTDLSCPDEIFAYRGEKFPKINLAGKYNINELSRYAMHYDGIVDDCKCELWAKGNSKATGMKLVCDKYFPGYSSVAIGDSKNDAEMLRAADISVAMGNADDGIKNMCMFTAPSCEDDGAAQAIEKLISE